LTAGKDIGPRSVAIHSGSDLLVHTPYALDSWTIYPISHHSIRIECHTPSEPVVSNSEMLTRRFLVIPVDREKIYLRPESTEPWQIIDPLSGRVG
jgi:hypothetical protein